MLDMCYLFNCENIRFSKARNDEDDQKFLSSGSSCSTDFHFIKISKDSKQSNEFLNKKFFKLVSKKDLISKSCVSTETILSDKDCVGKSTQKSMNTASNTQSVASCSTGSTPVATTLKNTKLESIDENTSGSKSSAANGGAGDAPEHGKLEIEAALQDANERQKFLDFLNQQYCSENLYFYFSVREYQQLKPDDAEGRLRLGNQIYERHFASNCNEPVNVEYSTHKAILDAKRKKDFNPKTYDQAQYQIFHLLKYDVWPRYIRSEMEKRSSKGGVGCAENDVSSEHSSCGEGAKNVSKRPSVREYRYCLVLAADSMTAEKEVLSDPLISVKKWTETMAQRRGMDKNSTEVVDAQTGSTIDPSRQAIDALNNRHVRLMPVVRFPVDFLAPTVSSKNTSPMPVKVVMLRVRQGLTLNKVIRPLLIKYNYDPTDVAACFAGTCDPVPMSTTVASITPRMITIMTQQQYKERKLLPKREYQKELVASPILALSPELALPYFQHGDIAFYECPTEIDTKNQKHSAIRSHSTNPRIQELFKFGRKASQAKSKSDNEGNIASGNILTAMKPGGSDRRKSIGTAGRATTLTPSNVALSDIPYCGESSLLDDTISNKATASPKAKKEKSTPTPPSTAQGSVRLQQPLSKEYAPKPSPVPTKVMSSEGRCVTPKDCFEMPEFLKESNAKKINEVKTEANGNAPKVPAIYASAVRSDKESVPPAELAAEKISWYADYV
uniref:RGS domain-containing protein n=1 Tax=Panagrolaimus sp. JU765 TaxID=591449 RepID=A0AC34QKA6_9BILA